MAQTVLIDIPGIGQVEAKNAASEATLQEILKIMRKFDKSTDGGKKTVDDGSGSTSGSGSGGSAGEGGKVNKATALLGRMAFAAGFALAKVDTAARMVAGGFAGLAEGSTDLIRDFANVGNDLNKAASIFSKVPILGTMFSAVAAAATGAVDAYQKATASGATFSGSINQFSAAASSAGMTMAEFGGLIAKNGNGMLAFGGTTESGAKRFAQVSRQLQATSSDLFALGYSTTEINEGLAKYGDLLRTQGRSTNKSNAEMVAGAKSYLKEMDALAKITGEERSAKEAEAKRLASDAQFQAATANMDEKAADSFRKTVLGLPAPLQGFVKDFLATGTLTSEETQRVGAIMGGDVMNELQRMRDKMKSGTALTDAEQDRFRQILAAAGKTAQKSYGDTFAATREFDGAMQASTAAASLNVNANKEATAAQKEAKEKTDKMNEAIERNKQSLAAFSNAFQMALANSGMLDLLMKAFEFTANFVMAYVVPLFNVLSASVQIIAGSLIDSFGPAVISVGGFFNDILIPAIKGFTEFLAVDVIPAIAETFENLKPSIQAIGDFIMNWVVPSFKVVAGFILDNLTPIIKVLAIGLAAYGTFLAASTLIGWANVAMDAARAAASIPVIAGLLALGAAVMAPIAPFLLIAGAVVGLVLLFKKLGGDTQVISDTFKLMGLKFKDWFLTFKEALFSLINKIPGFRGDFDKDLEEIHKEQLANQQERDKVATGITERMANNREAAKTAEEKKREEKKQAISDKIDKASHSSKLAGVKQQEDANAKDKAAKDAKVTPSVDFNANGADLLKQVAANQGSALIKDSKPSASASADNVKKTIEQDGEKKQAAQKAAEDKKAAEEKKQEDKKDTKPTTTQDSPETLLASLNTKMDQLIKVNKSVFEVAENQLSVSRGMTKNLYKM